MESLLKLAVERKIQINQEAVANGDSGAMDRPQSMKQFAACCGLKPAAFSNKLSGARSLSLEEAHRIATLLEVNLEAVYLLVS